MAGFLLNFKRIVESSVDEEQVGPTEGGGCESWLEY